MQRYESYRPSGIQWIEKIPSHWGVERAKWLFNRMERPVRPEDEVVTAFRDGQVTLRTNRRTEGFTNALQEHGYQGIRKGDLVIHAMDAFAGAIGVSDSDGKSTPVYAACVPRGEFPVNSYYYAYLLRHMAHSGYIESLSKGIRERSTDFRFAEFGELPLPIPDKDEQDRIVAFLDQKTTQIDAAITKKKRQIEALQEKRKIRISRAVTQGLRLGAALKDSGSVAIGTIPTHWETRRLKHATQRIYDCKNRTPDYFPDGEFFVVRTTNVKKGRLVMEGALYTDAKGFAEWTQKGLPKAGELVITREAPAGEVALLPPGFVGCLGQRTMGIVPDEQQVLAKFLLYFLQSDAFDQYVTRQGSGSTVAHLRVGQVFDIPLAFPPNTKEQQEIVDYLEEEERRTDLLVEQELRAIRALREFKSVVIASTIAGQLKV
ncbi:type I restriction enzyme specificity protein [Burkholderia pseudomallei]|uniref:restriction endonuclease subunit S n=1 Tax=Burkholderia pseudomallei TaxID=28450 RepID=UPI0009776370|nr:restriction endonuclease subunit S [Burkholderia pseudomallei]MVZ88432.1 restriction endonuclease subunit S [Burkholderia pseudomallei]MWA22144.1 restriction endonuclease subunit S [Burkholderia pseudomallei]MWA25962.1 restriction endonuclease subunit S [Burkholderia pseudomallei]OMS02943.1 hypothetical protein AQ731_07170 [Burkholderia pseudomallei]OMS39683.1 hypothetical protein AQ741_30795 [Burkholderia pseudomallei]